MGSSTSTSESRAREWNPAETTGRREPASRAVATDVQLLRRANSELELLYAVEQQISAAADLPELIACVLEQLIAHLRFEAAALLLVSSGDGEVTSVLRGAPAQRRAVPRSQALSWLTQTRVRSSRAIEATDAATCLLAELPSARLVKAYNAPVSGGGNDYGVLQLVAPRELPESDELVLRRLALVAAQLGRAIMLRREREQHLRSEGLSQLGQSLGAISHELHTPLMAVAGYVEIMASADAQEVRREYAERVGRGLEHIERMVYEALSFVRGQREICVSSLSLDRFIDETRELLEPELNRFGAALEMRAEYTGSVRFDAHKLRRALWNLARCAAEAGAKHIVWKFSRHGEYLAIECSDTGPGVPQHMLGTLFETHAGHEQSDALGLGLAMAKAIIDAHCGHIQMKSDPGHGTVFRIELPF